MDAQDNFYFYNSSIGDLTKLIRKYAVSELAPTPGFITNAFGVKINPKHLPQVLAGREGVEPLPIPANWHADIAEFGGALRAVDLAKESFTVVELGCGWGCWLNITGVVARRKGLRVQLIGVEGDIGHVRFAKESLTENGFSENEFTIHHGMASAENGLALFPKQEQAGVNWGLEAIFDLCIEKTKEILKTGKYEQLRKLPLQSVLPESCDHIDLLHVDIQGAEIPLIPHSIDFLNNKVAMVLVGTHCKKIEATLFDSFLEAAWVLEVERPAVLSIGRSIQTLVDGVQLWRNPRLLPDEKVVFVDPVGSIEVLDCPSSVKSYEKFELKVEVKNKSRADWLSERTEYPVSLSYHWIGEDGDYLVFDGMRTSFNGTALDSQATSIQSMQIEAPNCTGQLKLLVTVVQDGVRWFDTPDFESVTVDIKVG